MENVDIMVDFNKYCRTCKYKDFNECDDPCNDCLDYPTNVNSERPLRYEADEKLVAEEAKKEQE